MNKTKTPPVGLLIDGPANGFPAVQRAELRYATADDVQTLKRRDCGCRHSTGWCNAKLKPRPGGAKRLAILPIRRQSRYAIIKWWMRQGRACWCWRSRVLAVNDKEVMGDAPFCSLQLLAQSDRARKSGNHACPNLSVPKCRNFATRHVGSLLSVRKKSTMCPDLCGFLVRLSPIRSRLASTSGGRLS